MNEMRRQLLAASLAAALLTLTNRVSAASTTLVIRMPSIFVGHGSPMNALADSDFTRTLQKWGSNLGTPTAILVVSAHWLTPGETKVAVQPRPRTIHDFGGFPAALHEMQYPAAGAPEFAKRALDVLTAQGARPSEDWGLDHGTWTVLHHMYPKADIPVFQVSIDYAQTGEYHLAAGKALSALRDQGVLVMGSGNVVHNLRATQRGRPEEKGASQQWAQTFDNAVKVALVAKDNAALADYLSLDEGAKMAVPTPDHYWPLLYALGAARDNEEARFVFEGFQSGTLSMRCVQWG